MASAVTNGASTNTNVPLTEPLKVSVTAAFVDIETGVEAIGKVVLVAPAGTNTVPGTDKIGSQESGTVTPSAGAAPLSLTVPVPLAPPTKIRGAAIVALNALTASVAVLAAPFSVTDMVAVPSAATRDVATLNVAVVAPAATDTVGSTAANDESDESGSTKPPAGAGLLKTIVPTEGVSPNTEVEESFSVAILGALTVTLTVLVTPFSETVIGAGLLAATVEVATGNVAVVAPPGTTTVEGMATKEDPPVRSITMPADGAGARNVTMPVAVAPPTTDGALRPNPAREAR